MATLQNQREKKMNPKSMPLSAVTGRDSVSEERIRFRAYLLFEERQRAGMPGDSVSDWLHARRELNQATRPVEQTRHT